MWQEPPSLLRLAPPLTVLLFIGPVVAGLLGTAMPAFGWMPSLGATVPGLEPWRRLLATPGLPHSVALAIGSGLGGALIALAAAIAIAAATHGRPGWLWLTLALPVLLAVPHLASAVGFAFLITPSGWLARLVSPWLTGWQRPPAPLALNAPRGVALPMARALREAPFLLFALQAAAGQTDVARQLRVARSLG